MAQDARLVRACGETNFGDVGIVGFKKADFRGNRAEQGGEGRGIGRQVERDSREGRPGVGLRIVQQGARRSLSAVHAKKENETRASKERKPSPVRPVRRRARRRLVRATSCLTVRNRGL